MRDLSSNLDNFPLLGDFTHRRSNFCQKRLNRLSSVLGQPVLWLTGSVTFLYPIQLNSEDRHIEPNKATHVSGLLWLSRNALQHHP
jgi:hypothetical protein